jgi:hypothetical protein
MHGTNIILISILFVEKPISYVSYILVISKHTVKSGALFCLYQCSVVGRVPQSVWLLVGRSGDRIPLRARFSSPVQSGHGAHTASCTMGTGSFPGVKKWPESDADPSPPSSAEV